MYRGTLPAPAFGIVPTSTGLIASAGSILRAGRVIDDEIIHLDLARRPESTPSRPRLLVHQLGEFIPRPLRIRLCRLVCLFVRPPAKTLHLSHLPQHLITLGIQIDARLRVLDDWKKRIGLALAALDEDRVSIPRDTGLVVGAVAGLNDDHAILTA